MNLFEHLRWPFVLIFYPAVILTGFIIGSADLSFKSEGLLISQHLETEVMSKFKRERAHLDSFHAIVSKNYGNISFIDEEGWFFRMNLTLVSPSDTESTKLSCSDLNLATLRREAFASLWYYPELFSDPNFFINGHAFGSERTDIDHAENVPNTILFFSTTLSDLPLNIIRCENYLLFIQNWAS